MREYVKSLYTHAFTRNCYCESFIFNDVKYFMNTINIRYLAIYFLLQVRFLNGFEHNIHGLVTPNHVEYTAYEYN